MAQFPGYPTSDSYRADETLPLPRYCLECPVRFACHGGCPRNRFIQTPDGEDGLNYLCAGYKAFFTHVDHPMRLMANLLRAGRYADEVMGILAQEEGAESGAMTASDSTIKKSTKTKRGRRKKK